MTALAIANAAYLAAALLFIMSLAGLSKHETGSTGVRYGIAGMTIAMVATIWLSLSGEWNSSTSFGLILLVVALIAGAIIGLWRAKVVAMTGMPELIALFHSFVGLTAVLVGWNGALHTAKLAPELVGVHRAEVFIGVFIGAITFTGSIVAYLKLSAKIS
jgi:NAD(P) transhydrogenase subunit beta